MRAPLILVAAIAAAAGCDNSACRGVDGTCVALTVAGAGSVDGLEIALSGAATGTKIVPPIATRSALPVEVGLALAHASTGMLHIDVTGVLLGDRVGDGSVDLAITAGAHTHATVTLGSGGNGDGGADLAVGPPIEVAGTRVRHYVVGDGGVVDVPTDFTQVPIDGLVENAGVFTSVKGTGDASGHFQLSMPSSPYYLHYFDAYAFGSAMSPDLSAWALGRSDQTFATAPTTLTFNVGNAAAWSSADTLELFALNAGTAVFSVEDALKPAAGVTTLTGSLDLSRAAYGKLIDASKGDDAMLLQLVNDTTGARPYRRLGKLVHFAPFTIANGGAQTLTATMTDVAPTLSLAISWARTQFAPYMSAINPGAALDYELFDVFAQPGGIAHGSFDSTPDLVALQPASDGVDLSMTLSYGNPFPSSWPLAAAVGGSYGVTYAAPGAATAGTFDGSIYAYHAVDSLPSPIVPLVSPVQQPTINGRSAFTQQASIGAMPIVAWQPPALGTPSSYAVYAYALDDQFGGTRLDFAAQLYTTSTSVRIPPGMLVGGQSYVFVISAFADGIDHSVTPFDGALPSGFADALSGAVGIAPPATVDGATCLAIRAAHPTAPDGVYVVGGAGGNFATYCDMTTDGGGWTLVGKIDGRADISPQWLVQSVNPWQLTDPTITDGMFSCANAVPLAIDAATEVRLANSARTKWVKWPMPTGRSMLTWWHHDAGQAVIGAAAQTAVTVHASTGATATCYQNVYGINPASFHGGSYPATMGNTTGNTTPGDWCMGVGTLLMGSTADGFTQNGNGADQPTSESDWPNAAYNVPAHVSVWLR